MYKSTVTSQYHIKIPTPPTHNMTASTPHLTSPITPIALTNAHGATIPLPRKKIHPSPHAKDINTAPNHQIPLPFKTTRILCILTLSLPSTTPVAIIPTTSPYL